ncbi:MAG: type II secretion system secretin GspD [Caulobacteraceae bacterium]|nr:type II secretion system secretin GspD [Caulobacteraceae bacterium]
MTRSHAPQAVLCLAALLSGCASTPPSRPVAAMTSSARPASTLPETPPSSLAEPGVSTTIMKGSDAYPAAAAARATEPRPGAVRLNLPGVEVQDFAKAVLGDILGLPYAVDSSAKGTVTLVTARPIAKSDVLPMVEDALKTSGLALEFKNGVYVIVPLDKAKAEAPGVSSSQAGYGNETVTLRYANPTELKTLLEPVAPGVITAADTATGALVLSGASGQRKAVRELVQQFDVDWMKGMSFALFIPKNTDARLIAPELNKLINAPGSTTAGLVRLVAMERLNGIVAIASRAQYLDDVRRWIEVLDHEGQSSERRLYVYRVQNGRAADLSRVLVAAFGGAASGSTAATTAGRKHTPGEPGQNASTDAGLSSSSSAPPEQTLPGQSPAPVSQAVKIGASTDALVVTSDETNNAVVAYATPREYALIEDALRKLDITPLQVVIETAITEITLNDTLKYGTQWYFRAHGAQYALSQGTTATLTQSFPGFAYTLFNSGGAISATLDALSTVTHVKVLSAPNLLVLNNQTASLQVGDQVPISTGSAISTTAANAPVVNSIDYRDTGVILKVTPRVNSSGLVLLDISQEVSQVTPSTASTNPISSPVISERKIASSIAVQDGQTIALGGLISDNVSKSRGGIPFLSAIPVLGALAGNRDDERKRTELLVLLTPRVIRDPVEAQAITDELKQKIRVLTPLRPRFEP